jgi:small conductance mechanosensitive channel
MNTVKIRSVAIVWSLLLLWSEPLWGQEKTADRSANNSEKTAEQEPPPKSAAPVTPDKVQVAPAATDKAIATRLQRILTATEWFEDPQVSVDEGVVFLQGRTTLPEYRDWAATLATKTEDVVAVVNHLEVTERSAWDFSPAWAEMRSMGRKFIQSLPLLLLSIIVLVVTCFAAWWTGYAVDYLLRRRMPTALLRKVLVQVAMIPVWIVGIYIVLRTSGLTQMALTVLGGTGLAGLILGIAFQNIAENFLASILISIQRPFQANDFIEVAGYQGLVQRVTARGTVLQTVDGNHIQVPNATIYKNIIRNFSANPNSRLDFKVGIGYDNATSGAQEIVLKVLQDHSAVLKSPEPLVLVEELVGSCVNLRVYFWINAREHDGMKTKSSLLRLVKKALQDASVSLADPDREIVVPRAIPVHLLRESDSKQERRADGRNRISNQASHGGPPIESDRTSCQAEGHLRSDEDTMKQQAKNSRPLEVGPDLLSTANGDGKSRAK